MNKRSSDLNINDAYKISFDELSEKLSADFSKGLSDQEAKDRLKKYGKNKLKENKKRSIWQILLSQVLNPVIYLLTAAAVLAFVFGDIAEGIAIVIVLLINTMIGFWMEYKAEKSMDALKKMDKIQCRVLRDEEEKDTDAEKIVPGDILLVDSGDLIAADARIFHTTELAVDESPLTGESVPVSKTTDAIEEEKSVGDRTNILYKGTAVTNGFGKAIVYATGMDTELGNISDLVGGEEKDQIPLNKKLNKLTQNLIWVTIGLAVAFALFGLLAGKELYQLIQTSIAWTIAAIPEGLPIVASIALARGMIKLARKNVIVKKLEAVETLGETTVIFTDKTGTLTLNKLSVQSLLFPKDKRIDVDVNNKKKSATEYDNDNFNHFLKTSVLANDASLPENDNDSQKENKKRGDGDPLEIALLQYAKSYDNDKYLEYRELERKRHDPFDSDDMVMGAVYEDRKGYYVAGKGAAHAIMKRSSKILIQGKEENFGEEDKNYWMEKNDELADEGLRVLAFGYKKTKDLPKDNEEQEFLQDLIFIGLVGFLDPPRKEVIDAIALCKEAGIKVVMVTGDHPGTAKNVGEQIDLFDDTEKNNNNALSGKELQEALNNDDNEKLINTLIFSRVSPKQKLSLVEHFQEKGEIAAMTGDGVNDAPALKKANIGIAMGKRGTQIAQEVSDMVLKDDAFGSIVNAIEHGRIIFGNIRKFIVYQLSYHLSEILIIGLISFTLFTLPLLPLQLLFLNLLSDVFPALALGVGKGDPGVMKQPPKNPNEPILNKKNWLQIGLYALVLMLSISGGYYYAHFVWEESVEIKNNIAFFSLAIAQLIHVFNMRNADEHFFINQVTRNKYIWMALAICFAALFAAYLIPGIADVLSFEKLEWDIWALIAICSILPFLVIQIIKFLYRKLS
jgi:Ca2+-transporting ATPase